MTSEAQNSRKIRRVIVYTISTVFFTLVAIGLLYGLRPLLLPFVLGGFLAYLFKPIAKSFRGSTLSNFLRAGVLLYFVGLIVYWCFSIVKSSLPNDVEKLQIKVRLQYRLNERYQKWMGLEDKKSKGNYIYQNFGGELDQLKQKALEHVKLSDDERKEFLLNHESYADADISTLSDSDAAAAKYYKYYLANLKAQKVDFAKIKTAAKEKGQAIKVDTPAPKTNALASLIAAFSNWIVMPLAFIFILLDKGQIIHFFIRLIPNRYFELTHTIFEKVDDALGKYIRGTMIECFLVGLTLIVGFYLCGFQIKIAVLIGLLGGLTNAIPFVGTLLACAFGIAYSLIGENLQPLLPFINEDSLILAVVGVVMIAHLLDNAIFQPLVVGSAVNLHPLVVILGVFGGSIMFGFAGLIFAIPSIVVFKVVTETFFTGLKDYRII